MRCSCVVPFLLAFLTAALSLLCSTLMAAHCTAGLRHDAVGAETLLNLLLRNYLAYNLYDQVRKGRQARPGAAAAATARLR